MKQKLVTLLFVFFCEVSFSQTTWHIFKDKEIILSVASDSILPLPNGGYITQNKEEAILLPNSLKQKTFKKIKINNTFICAQNKNDLWGTYDFSGKNIIPSAYHDMGVYSNGLLPVCYNNRWGFVDKNGNTIIHIRYDSVKPFINNVATVYLNNNTIYIDQRGNKTELPKKNNKLPFDPNKIPHQKGDQLLFESEGFVGIKRDGHYGFTDTKGILRIANRYDSIMPFNHGKAQFKLNGKWGLLDKFEKIILSPLYDEIGDPLFGLIPVRSGKLWGLVNTKDEQVISFSFDELTNYKNKGWVTKKGKKTGIINMVGLKFINPIFEDAFPLDNKLFAFSEDDKWGVMDFKLNTIVPAQYQAIYLNPFNGYLIVKD